MINVTFSPIVSEYLKIMLKKYRITDTGSSGVKKFLSQKIVEEYKSLVCQILVDLDERISRIEICLTPKQLRMTKMTPEDIELLTRYSLVIEDLVLENIADWSLEGDLFMTKKKI